MTKVGIKTLEKCLWELELVWTIAIDEIGWLKVKYYEIRWDYKSASGTYYHTSLGRVKTKTILPVFIS